MIRLAEAESSEIELFAGGGGERRPGQDVDVVQLQKVGGGDVPETDDSQPESLAEVASVPMNGRRKLAGYGFGGEQDDIAATGEVVLGYEGLDVVELLFQDAAPESGDSLQMNEELPIPGAAAVNVVYVERRQIQLPVKRFDFQAHGKRYSGEEGECFARSFLGE